MILKLIIMAALSMLSKRSICRPSFSAQPIFLRRNYFEEGFYLSCRQVDIPECFPKTCRVFRSLDWGLNFVK
ncbi:hypothetical protein AMTRI_Chr09g37010 [Amborella trichopoda]